MQIVIGKKQQTCDITLIFFAISTAMQWILYGSYKSCIGVNLHA